MRDLLLLAHISPFSRTAPCDFHTCVDFHIGHRDYSTLLFSHYSTFIILLLKSFSYYLIFIFPHIFHNELHMSIKTKTSHWHFLGLALNLQFDSRYISLEDHSSLQTMYSVHCRALVLCMLLSTREKEKITRGREKIKRKKQKRRRRKKKEEEEEEQCL